MKLLDKPKKSDTKLELIYEQPFDFRCNDYGWLAFCADELFRKTGYKDMIFVKNVNQFEVYGGWIR
jgi:hypothetical protein